MKNILRTTLSTALCLTAAAFAQTANAISAGTVSFVNFENRVKTEPRRIIVDPESGRMRRYYPDFLAKMKDGKYRLIEVKADDMVNEAQNLAKQEATEEMTAESGFEYKLYKSSEFTGKISVLDEENVEDANQESVE